LATLEILKRLANARAQALRERKHQVDTMRQELIKQRDLIRRCDDAINKKLSDPDELTRLRIDIKDAIK
jgi:hypothetical protein